MEPATVFQISSAIAIIGWLALAMASPFFPGVEKFLIGIIITLLAIVYTWFVISCFKPGDFKNFGSLDGMMKLFQNKTLVTAGWVHYLAFDLMVGVWIKSNSVKYGISHWLIIPCLFFTFMLGPVGLLLYLLIRFIKTRNYFSASF